MVVPLFVGGWIEVMELWRPYFGSEASWFGFLDFESVNWHNNSNFQYEFLFLILSKVWPIAVSALLLWRDGSGGEQVMICISQSHKTFDIPPWRNHETEDQWGQDTTTSFVSPPQPLTVHLPRHQFWYL